jgi:hypothetical protein
MTLILLVQDRSHQVLEVMVTIPIKLKVDPKLKMAVDNPFTVSSRLTQNK